MRFDELVDAVTYVLNVPERMPYCVVGIEDIGRVRVHFIEPVTDQQLELIEIALYTLPSHILWKLTRAQRVTVPRYAMIG